jgi:hypothetical protein
MIPENINRNHIKKAIDYINKNGVPPKRNSTIWDLDYGGRTYPSKYLICIDNVYANGNELTGKEFSGGIEINRFINDRGFSIVEKQ